MPTVRRPPPPGHPVTVVFGRPRFRHPRVIATAHTAALTGGFFRDAAWRLGEALQRWLHGLPPENLLVPLPQVPPRRQRGDPRAATGKRAVMKTWTAHGRFTRSAGRQAGHDSQCRGGRRF
jgi:hypothetical protein